jgi:hypothetical protein
MSSRMFPKLKKMHKYTNLTLCNQLSAFVSSLLSHFIENGKIKTYKNGGGGDPVT